MIKCPLVTVLDYGIGGARKFQTYSDRWYYTWMTGYSRDKELNVEIVKVLLRRGT